MRPKLKMSEAYARHIENCGWKLDLHKDNGMFCVVASSGGKEIKIYSIMDYDDAMLEVFYKLTSGNHIPKPTSRLFQS